MAKRPYRWKWTAPIDPDTLLQLQQLARGLGFLVTTPGTYYGNPSPASLLDAIAECYEVDPGGTHLALKVLLQANALLPSRPADIGTLGEAE